MRILTIHTTEMERKRRKKKLPSVMTSTESGNSTMPATTEVRFRGSKKKTIAARTGMISACRHISRWKDMMHLSMPTYSIRGKVTKTFIRVRFRSTLTRLQVMLSTLKCRKKCRENVFLSPSRVRRAALHYGSTDSL